MVLREAEREEKEKLMTTNVHVPMLGEPDSVGTPGVLRWLGHSRIAAVGWAAMRVWLGIMWIQAGWSKLWGAENASFLHHNGAGVAGFATAGLKLASYSWWGHFLHGFVIPQSGWIGVFISVSELVIGFALVLGVFTAGFAFFALFLNLTYMLSGSAGVNPVYALFAVVLIATWRTSGWIGADGLLMGYLQRRRTHPAQDQAQPAQDRKGLVGILRHAHAA
jgi:thiosulfate dehydrogenase (quinone) large subunit